MAVLSVYLHRSVVKNDE